MEPSQTLSTVPGRGSTSTLDNLATEQQPAPDAQGREGPIAPSTDVNGDEDTNKIVAAINSQSASLNTVFESLTTAIEALKQKPQSPDKVAFWTAYKTLADEFDKEIQSKYGDNLDTSLIFAGLFSAVSSAFIIQIQPELQPDPTQALLALLVQNITGLPPALLPSGGSTSQAPALSVVVAQSLLYFTLFATLLAALLAVLGKQWLLHYNSVGERGTIAERGAE
ncbi:hypothetical protein DFH08DRAFT_966662 [Mycena albidolilacea]|uniref:DUF6535 domain-containing protein n=1 Tax=Mycena albidolilacea TaxID=1033008 RepID=A0AAD6ZPP1_9AGAR|nr:hypothetical protein DFH08DRAFT_966662 [Mycena albidolilacea]